MKYFIIFREKHKEALLEKALMGDSFFLRLKGLIGKKEIDEREGIILYPCSSIHCFGMKFPIDVIFLDKEKRVLSIYKNLQPNKMVSEKKAVYTIEMKGGMVQKKRLKIGEILNFINVTDLS